MGFPGGSEVKASAWNAGDQGSIPVSGRSPGEGNSNPLQYSCLETSMDRGAWQTTIHGGSKESNTTEWLTPTLGVPNLHTLARMYCCLVAQSCLTLCIPKDRSPQAPLSIAFSRQEYWDVGCYSLLQGILLNQGLNPHLLRGRQSLLQGHQGNAGVKVTRI